MTVLSPADVRAAGTTENGVPRLVVSILVDQLRSDYLEAFMPLYGENGFKRLFTEGRVYTQADYPMAQPDCASAAATLATGTTPSSHGIIGRRWLDRETLRPVFCVDDTKYAGTGNTSDKSAPTFLGVSTIGDELKVATDGKAIVYAIAPAREAAILSAGHAADGAVWIDDRTGQWCSTSYYGALPTWASVRNSGGIASRIRALTWQPSSDLVGNFSYFLSGGMKKPFNHKFKGATPVVSFKTSGLVNEEVTATATTCLNGTLMGHDGITDHLAVTFYAGNFEHKSAAEAGMELQDTYVRLDQAVAELIGAVEKGVGLDNALFVLTSTGYTDENNAATLSQYRIPTGSFDVSRAAALLNMYLTAIYGQGTYVEATLGTQLYLNHKLLETKQLNQAEVLERSQDFLLQLAGVKDVYTSQRLLLGAWTPGISRIRGGYNPQYSGDIMIEVAAGWHYVNENTHENQLVRESYISYPIIFFGCGVKAEKVETPVTVDRIAPTLSKAMRIRAPNACSVAPLF